MEEEKKLRQFEEYVLTKAKMNLKRDIQMMDKTMELKLKESIKKYQKGLDKDLENEIAKLQLIKNRVLYIEKKNLDKTLNTQKKDYQQDLLDEVEKKLNEFVKTEDYIYYLNQVMQKIDTVGCVIYLTPEDYKKRERFNLKHATCEMGENFIGGYLAVMQNKRIDNTFQTKLRSNYANP